jgi:sugar (pentulose or hexulose) kinase
MTAVFVGVDVGTTRIKAVAIDPAGRVAHEAERRTPWRGTEIDPDELVTTAAAVAAQAAGDGPAAGIGVTGMAETGVLVDRHDRPLAPSIAWHDPRGDVDRIARELGEATFRRTTGLPLTALPSLSKLLWLRSSFPRTREARRFYSVGEWVIRRLGGRPVAELSLASRTGLLDLAAARPWPAALDLLGLPGLLPEPVLAGTAAGTASGEDVPAVLRGAVLTVAGHDHQVAAYATGAAVDGALLDSLGTAEALVRFCRAPVPPDAVDTLTAAGLAIGQGVVAGHLCILAGLKTGITLDRLAVAAGATGNAARAALATPEWLSTVDEVCAAAGRILTEVERVCGPHREVVAAGGWLANGALRAAKRRQFPGLRISDVAEPGAYGAALMARAAAGGCEPIAAPQKAGGAWS